MNKNRGDRGSALLITVIVVFLAAGIGGALMAQSLIHSREQQRTTEADEALGMCDAGMERARQALDVYRGLNGAEAWSWDGVLTYCSTLSGDPVQIRKDYLSRMNSAAYTSYASKIWSADAGARKGADTLPAAKTVPPSAATTNVPSSTDPTAANVFIGWNQPFNRGAVHVMVRNNGGAGDTATHDEDGQVLIVVTATLPSGLQRQVEGLLTLPSAASIPLKVSGVAAVVSNDKVDTNGNITIDGRDYDYSGTKLTGDPGVFGVLSTKTITTGGASAIGGVGIAPPKKGTASGTTSQNASFKTGYPATPDEVVGVPAGTLKKSAQSDGTYCATAADFSALLAKNGGKLPDHAIVYCDFDPGNGSFSIGSGNEKSSILVIHNDASTTSVKNLHGAFKGLLIADSVNHVNSGTALTGMVQLLSPTSSAGANVFGNGNATVRFSSAVLADLPGASSGSSGTGSTLTSYRRTF